MRGPKLFIQDLNHKRLRASDPSGTKNSTKNRGALLKGVVGRDHKNLKELQSKFQATLSWNKAKEEIKFVSPALEFYSSRAG